MEKTEKKNAKIKYRRDYRPPDYRISHVSLAFDLQDERTIVKSRLEIHRDNPAAGELCLNAEAMRICAVSLDGQMLSAEGYRFEDDLLIIPCDRDRAVVETEVRIDPAGNTALQGLYMSNGMFCTQCEAEGFRRITPFIDRPDVLAVYEVRITADRERYPVLLSNGNLIETGDAGHGRHWARWQDPFPKPSYLFALVAGDLRAHEDSFTTASGRKVALRIYVEEKDLPRCGFAMDALKRAMRWDEERFGREYDLDVFMIVAVEHFNFGAMENKGLNIFNSKYILADPATATDMDYAHIESIVAHEYFHNWTGNRITCRDWFQLSLKEGLTVFRDQEFSADQGMRDICRVRDVRQLRAAQFPEDAGPTAHPVRPDSYMEIDNFYTATVYEKGAEVIRMIQEILGREGFRKGMDLYFSRHDGQAVTCDDFVQAMEDATGADLSVFRRWYDQAGTPVLEAALDYDRQNRQARLSLRQSCPPTPGQPVKKPLHIPVRLGLLDGQGRELPLRIAGEGDDSSPRERMLHLREESMEVIFEDIPEPPRPSLLRGFSAPVILKMARNTEDDAFFLSHDSDFFNRWEAAQNLGVTAVFDHMRGRNVAAAEQLVEAAEKVLADPALSPAHQALLLTLPGETYLAQKMQVIEVDRLHDAHEAIRRSLGTGLREEWAGHYERLRPSGPYRYSAGDAGRRSLRNLSLGYLYAAGPDAGVSLALEQYHAAGNMTDAMAALSVLADAAGRPDGARRDACRAALEDFYNRWRHDANVIDKWFSVQATVAASDTLSRVEALQEHPAFDPRSPNKVRALIGAFAMANPVGFHRADGRGYAFVADWILKMDAINAQVAARLAAAFREWRRHDAVRQALMEREMRRILDKADLSRGTYEIVSRSLQAAAEGEKA